MVTHRDDLVAVAMFAWAIRCDDDHYRPETREAAFDLWFLAVQLVRSLEHRRLYPATSERSRNGRSWPGTSHAVMAAGVPPSTAITTVSNPSQA
jgi:hypothetical protein